MFKRYFGALVLCLCLAGCGSFKKQWVEFTPDRDRDYLDAKTAPALTMPAGVALNKHYLSDPYPVPKGPLPSAGSKPVDIYPPILKKPAENTTDDSATDAS